MAKKKIIKRETSSVRIVRSLRNALNKQAVSDETTIGKIIEEKFDWKDDGNLPTTVF
jgi:hypothetical protein